MPYNGSGTYTPPAADFPAVTQTVISSTKFNNILNDVAAALTNAVTRDGQSPMTAALPMGGWPINAVALGTAAAPSINFSGASTTGFFATAGALGFSVAGVERARFDNSNGFGIGTVSPVSGAGLTIGNDSLGTAVVKASFSTTGVERGSVQLNGASGEMRLTAGYAGYGGFLSIYANGAERGRFDAAGNLAIGTTNAGTAGLSLSQSFNLSWEQSASESIATIFRQSSSAALVLASGYKRSATANGFASSYATSWPKTAISLGTVAGGITFYTDAAAAVAVGTDITPTERMRIDSSGNVGIGTTSPSYKLDIAFNADAVSAIRVFNSSTGASATATLRLETQGGNWTINNGRNGGFLSFSDGGGERARFDNSGNLGIGTASPTSRLVVSNAGAQGFEFDPANGILQVYNRSTSAYGELRPYGSLMRFFTGSSPTETMRLDASGNLLIATTSSPAYTSKLRLQGGLEVHSSQQLNIVPGNTSPYEIVNRSNGGFDFYPTGTTLAFRIAPAGNVTISAPSSGAALAINSVNTTTPYINYVTGGTTTVGAAGGASALPATPVGYVTIAVAGTSYKMPYYNT